MGEPVTNNSIAYDIMSGNFYDLTSQDFDYLQTIGGCNAESKA